MKRNSFFVILSICSASAQLSSLRGAVNESVSATSSCTAPAGTGFCTATSICSAGGGTSYAGYCSGASDIQCCIASCSTPSGSGSCEVTSSCSGTSYSGYCPGSSDVECCVAGSSSGYYGLDVSEAVSSSTASCFRSSGISYIIARAAKSTGSVDTNACTTLNSASAAGIPARYVYIFPCPTCSSSAATQINNMVSYLKSTCSAAWGGSTIWLDIEGSQYWTGSLAANQAWYISLVDACLATGYPCGVYSSQSQWSAIFGSSFEYGTQLPIWYAHYDNSASFSDWSSYSFGGWAAPLAKQYSGDVTLCSFGVDRNYAETA